MPKADLPFSQRRRWREPSLPLRSSSLFFMLSRREGGRRGGVMPIPVPAGSKTTLRSFIRVVVVASSSGIVRGLPVPRAPGEIFSDARAWAVHASTSMDAVEALETV